MAKVLNKHKIAVAMSGGVDSSVAAKLLKDQGHEVAGIFLHFWKEETPLNPPFERGAGGLYFENKCCSAQALLDARRVADKIGIPLYTLNFAEIFKRQVVDNFLSQYQFGQTPNPCVRCNKRVKVGYLLKQAKKLGFDYVATGHYARLKREFPNSKSQFPKNANNKNNYKLYKAKDKNKDQSYFLYTLSQEELAHLLFPLGNYTKKQVRGLAKKFKLPVAEKKESQEICFIPEKSHNEFLRRYLKLKPGPIVMTDGKVIGRHQGLPLYTIGQRKGIAIGGSGPYYAAEINYKTSTLYVVNGYNDKILYGRELIAKNVNWLSGVQPKLPLTCQAVIRYRHGPVKCVIIKISTNKFKVKFSKPQRAITPGQSAVFYSGEEILGGGIIC